jgi:DNA-binding protein Fis
MFSSSGHNPAPHQVLPGFLPGFFVTSNAPSLTILLLSGDPSIPAKLKHELRGVSLTVAKDFQSVPRAATKRGFDAIILETKANGFHDLAQMQSSVDPSHAVVLAGPSAFLQHAAGLLQGMRLNGHGKSTNGHGSDASLETYLESKLGDFVKGMKMGSARNLHPMLIKAVERPLITLALKETHGNQIQAAQLLGMNRNTLRKKIAELRIPVNRESARAR